ncbi:MAG TPA: ABC transporter ATP-binding protein [Mycobacteriales bacterium]
MTIGIDNGTAPEPDRLHHHQRSTDTLPTSRPTATGPDHADQSGSGWLRRLTSHCLRYRGTLLLAFGAALAGSGIAAVTPLMERLVIDQVILTRRQPLVLWTALLLLAGLLRFGAGFVRRYFAGRLALDVQHDLRTEVFGALQRLDGARQDQVQTGQVVSRAITDINMVQGLLSFLPIVTGNALLFVLSLAIMTVLSPPLTLVALAVVPALWYVALRSRNRLFPAAWEAQQQAANVAGVVEAAVTGVRVVKGFGQERHELHRCENASEALFASRMRSVRLTARYGPALRAVPALGQVGVLALGGWLALRGHISLGTFLAFSTYLGEMVAPVRMLANLLTLGQQARASVERVFEVMDSQPLISDRPDAIALPEGPLGIELDNVTFGYTRATPVLRNVSLHVRPGETLALVGSAGSGKSTVSLLLPRFYDVQNGAVRLGGHDVRDLTRYSLRAATGVVFEDSFLFSDTVRANIAYGHPEATDGEVVAAALAAQADGFIQHLPDGYDTVVGEQGLTLSGGQRQRIALARALLTSPRVLLLDDATSAVDARVEAEIHTTLRRAMAGRTTLLVAHRRSTLGLADRIAVFDRGSVLDVGTHTELTARCPLYRLLLSGPAENAEGLHSTGGATAPVAQAGSAGTAGTTPEVTAALWRTDQNNHGRPTPGSTPTRTAGPPGSGRGRGMGGGGMGSGFLSMPPTPELLTLVDALPPTRDHPHVDPHTARRAEPNFALRHVIRPFRPALALALLFVGLDALAQLALPALIRGGVDNGITRHAQAALAAASAAALAVVLTAWVINAGQTLATGRVGERMLYLLRTKTFAQLQRLGLDYYERELSGRIMTRMTTDVDALSTFVQTGLATAVVSLLAFAGVLVALLVMNWQMALVVLTVMPILAVATAMFRTRSSRAYTEARERVSTVNADLQENLAGVRVTQAFRREHHNAQRFAQHSRRYRDSRLRAQRYIATYFPFIEFLSELTAALVLATGASRVHDGALTTGALIAFLLYLDLFFSPVQQLSGVFDGYQQAAVGLRRLRDLLGTTTSTPEPTKPHPVGRLRGEIVLADVDFAYPGTDARALHGVSLRIEPGQTIALVGETGAGKSTVVKLAARFYDPTGGQVLVDGVDLRDYDLHEYRQRLGVVPQEAHLFAGTVRDAIAYGRPEATDAQVEAAARAVGAHDVVCQLTGGYLHQVGERGRNLSAGQRQLLALARAELVDPDILLLDEATASLDLATEAVVARATDALSRRRTTLVVAHRLSTAARADRIVVLDHGRLVEFGPHRTLLAAGGTYARLWAAFTADRHDIAGRPAATR